MRDLIDIVAAGVLTFILFWFAGAFVSVQPNLWLWSMTARYFLISAAFGAMFVVAASKVRA